MHRLPHPMNRLLGLSGERVLELPAAIRRGRPKMLDLAVILRLELGVGSDRSRGRRHVLLVMVVVLERRHGHKGQEMVRIGPARMQEVRRDRGAGEEVVRGGIGGGGQSSSARPTASAAASAG
ncbi:LOW QUALITY PROTEIN: hypothetical protein TorRG33x02_311560 [Trema orientale]|uniref:Uncharacterized protein n=1 Tax=Trema orientale TaxID=63057 RepID=A0A2P5BRF3_TREOI|nr:LOW QUALITY PROTEIN: hypothetical protein TorRG33x02_311560 [Trema orientale]